MNYIKEFLNKKDVFNTINYEHEILFVKAIKSLMAHHKRNCQEYKKFIDKIFLIKKIKKINNFPFLPVQIFKLHELKSIKDKEIFKKLSSSGTTSQLKSNIFLDKKNSENQIKVLNKILSQKFSKIRCPMLIIDRDPSKTNRSEFSASIAAIYGFSLIATKKFYLLKDNFEINFDVLNEFIKTYSQSKFYIFGFTSSIYQHLYQKLNKSNYNFSNGVLIHGGGWKKLDNLKISNKIFKELLNKTFKIKDISNYYGLVEQTGSIFFECPYGYFVSTIFSDVIIRGKNFEPLEPGKKGLIQLLSVLPSSYPGHSIITEDIGSVVKLNFKCKCGLNGKHFLVHGRAKEAELRGCSDAK